MPALVSKISFFFDNTSFTLKNRAALKSFIEGIFKKEKKQLSSLNYIFCTDKRLLEINKQYLDHDSYTDIISFDFSETKPMREGPVRKPISPPVVTMANPSTVLTPGILAEVLNSTGTIQQQPSPTTMYPAIATRTTGADTTIKKPTAAGRMAYKYCKITHYIKTSASAKRVTLKGSIIETHEPYDEFNNTKNNTTEIKNNIQ